MVIKSNEFADDNIAENFFNSFSIIENDKWKIALLKEANISADFPIKPELKAIKR